MTDHPCLEVGCHMCTVGSGDDVLFSAKWRLTRRKNKIHDNFEGCGGG
jgi:hypothetical protein